MTLWDKDGWRTELKGEHLSRLVIHCANCQRSILDDHPINMRRDEPFRYYCAPCAGYARNYLKALGTGSMPDMGDAEKRRYLTELVDRARRDEQER